MFRTIFKIAGSIALALGLSACQQTFTADPGVVAQLRAAGFEPSSGSPSTNPPSMTYICPKERCGVLVMLNTASETMIPLAGINMTAEQALRAHIYKVSSARTYLHAIANQDQNAKITINSVRIIPKAAEIRYGMTMTDRNKTMTVNGSAIMRIRGNTASMLMVAAEKPSIAQRYLRNQWVP